MLTLSQFLVRRADKPLIRIGPRLAPDDKTQPFTVTRLAVILLWRVAVGFLAGVVITRLAFDRWVAWPCGLLAGFSLAEALVVHGLTALCWNQRAARIRGNPEAAQPAIPGSLLNWLLATVYWIMLGLVTPLALVLTFENVRGELAWRSERAKLVAAGERLTIDEVLGPKIPVDQNAGTAPIFAPLFNYKSELSSTKPGGVKVDWRDTNAQRSVSQRLWLPPEVSRSESNKRNSTGPIPKKLTTPQLKLDDWADYYRQAVAKPGKDEPSWVKDLKLPDDTNNPANVVLAGLEPIASTLSEVAEAFRKPRSQFPIHFEDGFVALLPHLAPLKKAVLAYRVRSAARLSVGQTDKAAEDVDDAIRVAESMREEPLLISQLVRYAQAGLAASTMWQGLARHAWTEPQLARWQAQWEAIDYRPGFILAFEGERVCILHALDQLISSPEEPGDEWLEGWPILRRFGAAIFSRGFIRQNEVILCQFNQSILDEIRRSQTRSAFAESLGIKNNPAAESEPAVRGLAISPDSHLLRFTPAQEWVERTVRFSPYTQLLRMLAPALEPSGAKMVRAQALARMAAIACALERYRLGHGNYPESLADLSPGVMAKVPADPVTEKPFQYRRTDDGWFLLYSVGPNGVDDGGVYRKDKGNDPLDWPWPVPSRPAEQNLF